MERKFTRVYEDEDTIETWSFDLDKFERGPICVDIKYKAGAEKRIKARVKENKQIKDILKIFTEYFIPLEIEVRTTVICNKLNPLIIGKDAVDENLLSTELASNSYLGYNAVI